MLYTLPTGINSIINIWGRGASARDKLYHPRSNTATMYVLMFKQRVNTIKVSATKENTCVCRVRKLEPFYGIIEFYT